MDNTVDLSRFVKAHRADYERALAEIRSGRKDSCWMWYIFPQVKGLSHSSTSRYYAIESAEEARCFLADPYLGKNLREISAALLPLETNRARDVFWPPDDMKLRSCMTLFANLPDTDPVFGQVLDKFFGEKPCGRTLRFLREGSTGEDAEP